MRTFTSPGVLTTVLVGVGVGEGVEGGVGEEIGSGLAVGVSTGEGEREGSGGGVGVVNVADPPPDDIEFVAVGVGDGVGVVDGVGLAVGEGVCFSLSVDHVPNSCISVSAPATVYVPLSP